MNYDEQELKKFDNIASSWWDESGPMKMLHRINSVRMAFIQDQVGLKSQQVVDVGCGAGILSEALSRQGAVVRGIDASDSVIEVARAHANGQELDIDYQVEMAETYAQSHAGHFDVVTCLEMLEHVPDPLSVIRACSDLVKPGGWVFFSTIDRHPLAYLKVVVAAEYVLRWLPQGTHDYEKFIRPAELVRWARSVDLELVSMKGIDYGWLSDRFFLTENIKPNYLAAFQRHDQPA